MRSALLCILVHSLTACLAHFNRSNDRLSPMDAAASFGLSIPSGVVWAIFCAIGVLLSTPSVAGCVFHFCLTMVVFSLVGFPQPFILVTFYVASYIIAASEAAVPDDNLISLKNAAAHVAGLIPQEVYRTARYRMLGTDSCQKFICSIVKNEMIDDPQSFGLVRANPTPRPSTVPNPSSSNAG